MLTRRSIWPSTNLLQPLQASFFVFIHVLSSEIDFCLRPNNFRPIHLVISSAFSLVRTQNISIILLPSANSLPGLTFISFPAGEKVSELAENYLIFLYFLPLFLSQKVPCVKLNRHLPLLAFPFFIPLHSVILKCHLYTNL